MKGMDQVRKVLEGVVVANGAAGAGPDMLLGLNWGEAGGKKSVVIGGWSAKNHAQLGFYAS
jgi:hypothetical protein